MSPSFFPFYLFTILIYFMELNSNFRASRHASTNHYLPATSFISLLFSIWNPICKPCCSTKLCICHSYCSTCILLILFAIHFHPCSTLFFLFFITCSFWLPNSLFHPSCFCFPIWSNCTCI